MLNLIKPVLFVPVLFFNIKISSIFVMNVIILNVSLFITNEEFIKSKIKLKKYNQEWKKYSARKYVGDCSYLFEKLKPVSYRDFYEKYINDGQMNFGTINTNDYHRGRTEIEIIDNAKYLYDTIRKRYPDDDVNFVDCLNVTVGHTIHETYDGHIVENIVDEMFSKKGLRTVKPCGDADSLYGIDRFCYIDDALQFMLQIKPISFFKGNMNKSLIDDRISAFKKGFKSQEVFKVKTYYIIYDSSICNENKVGFVCKPNGKMAFELSELCNSDGTVKDIPKERCFNY